MHRLSLFILMAGRRLAAAFSGRVFFPEEVYDRR
jgi:hypothetical protein